MHNRDSRVILESGIFISLLINNQETIGGPGHGVVINKTFFNNGLAFLGGVDRTTKKIFIIQIYQRDANTLNSLILRHVLPDSIIFRL